MKLKQSIKVAILPILMYACATNNSASTNPSPSPSAKMISSVSITPTTVSLTEGDKSNLSATVKFSDGTSSTDVTWTSSDKNIANVGNDGSVVAFSAGSASISATAKTDSTKSSKVSVTVIKKPVPTPTPEPVKDAYEVSFELDGILPRIEIDDGSIQNLPLKVTLKTGPHTVKVYDLIKPCTKVFNITVDKNNTAFKYPCASGGN